MWKVDRYLGGKKKAPAIAGKSKKEILKSLTTKVVKQMRAVVKGLDDDQKKAIAKKLEKASQWIHEEKTKETEDLVFKLNILVELDRASQKVKLVAKELREEQKLDGGWGQIRSLPSDPYATATALYALLKSGMLKATDPKCQQAMVYLLDRQKEDGSWFVSSRSSPFQEYFESGFPHREDQFISITATCWAMIVLAEVVSGS